MKFELYGGPHDGTRVDIPADKIGLPYHIANPAPVNWVTGNRPPTGTVSRYIWDKTPDGKAAHYRYDPSYTGA